MGLAILLVVGCTFSTLWHPASSRSQTVAASRTVDFSLPIAFEPNLGQTADQVKFLSRAKGYRLFITEDEAVIALNGETTPHRRGQRPSSAMLEQPHAIHIKLLGANHAQQIDARDQLPGRVNYLIGSDSAQWHSGVPLYRAVTQHGVWPGIDLVYYGDSERQIESDFVIAPNANPQSIQLAIDGSDNLTLDHDGNLQIAAGRRSVTLLKPRIYQRLDGSDRSIDGRYVIDTVHDTHHLRFEVAAYDRSRTLVIDPKIELVYSTYLGGSAFDEGYAIAVDDARSAYVTGRTRSADFPATHGTLNDEEDAFVTKFSPDGQSLVYSTLIGGTGGKGITEAYAIFVSSDGHAYITGVANTSHFPTTQHAFQTNAPAGGGHPFVSELTLNGQSFVYSSYVGSSDHKPCSSSDPGVDWGTGIDVEDSTPVIWVTGITCSAHFPVVSPFQSSNAVDYPAGFLFAIDPGGFGFKPGLEHSTYLGGKGYTRSNAVALNHHRLAEKLAVWVTGTTDARNFPTKNAFQPHRHGPSDAFVMKFEFLNDSPFASLAYSTFLGGGGDDEALGLAVDGNGHAYVVGNFISFDFPITHILTFHSITVPGTFIAKFSQDGTQLIYSDALGGSPNQSGNSIAVFNGEAYVTGYTDERGFPVKDAFQDFAQGGRDVFVSKISQDGKSLVYSTYLGGDQDDVGNGIAVGPGGAAFVTGYTKSPNFPTQNAFQSTINSGSSAFVTKLELAQPTSTPTPAPTPKLAPSPPQ